MQERVKHSYPRLELKRTIFFPIQSAILTRELVEQLARESVHRLRPLLKVDFTLLLWIVFHQADYL
ncbi:MAG: hypothetical protein KatS3mg016_0394 [Fimbriimonadales bacterium]|nr:MAG: hypothetical protein KatS3mg016_0394 [Fimbriimonadales bacterium]